MSTPYQIRADLLKLSRDILESQSRAKKNKRLGSSHTFFPEGDEEITTEQIMAEAKKLNDFVSNGAPQNVVTGNLVVDGELIVRGNGSFLMPTDDFVKNKNRLLK